MAFGKKDSEIKGQERCKLSLKGNYATIEDLYNAVKGLDFGQAGKAEYVKHGFNYLIVFPPADRNNQVWITGKKNKFTVMRSTVCAGGGNVAKNIALSALTDGWSDVTAVIGDKKKVTKQNVTIVSNTIMEAGI